MSTMKRLACLAFALMLMTALVFAGAVTASAAESDEHCYLYGDVVEDGTLNPRDAIYALYHATLDSLAPGQFPVNQDCDFDGDGIVTSKDAIYLLYVVNKLMPNKGVIHAYYQPVWDWSNPENVTVTFLCGCGAGAHTYAQADGQVTVTTLEDQTVVGSCTTAGSITQQASVTVDEKTYTDTKTDVTPATGHTVTADGMTCQSEDRKCANCDYEIQAPAHIWEVESTTPATCKELAVEHQKCTACGETRDVTLQGEGSHVYAYVENGDKALGNCTYVKTYACIACGDTIDGTGEGDTYTMHNHKATLTKEADCSNEGVKTYTCQNTGCTDSYTEPVAKDAEKHAWNDGVSANGIITYTCTVSGCGETKTAVDATASGKVDTDALSGEVALPGGANLSMDSGAQSGLEQDSEVAISVEETNKDSLNLNDDLKAQIGDNPVYDFSMSYVGTNEQISSFDGMVTISLPYELQDGDDVDCIHVWYIDDNGQIKAYEGTYSNGFVTFQTDHFSYYTVTRLTPEQRCELYGHSWKEYYRAASCTLDGVDSKICLRCGKVDHNDVLPRLGHSYVETASTATCTEAGYITKVCQNPGCGHEVKAEVQELGHTLVVKAEESVAATCKAPGVIVSYCGREGCGIKHEEAVAQLAHQFGDYTTVPATCTTGGYDQGVCAACGEESIIKITGATGHNYQLNDGWAWSDDYNSATALLVCANDPSHTHTLKGTPKADTAKAPCVGTYEAKYTVTASFNNTAYTDSITVKLEGTGHIGAEGWESNGDQHYHLCAVCGEALEAEDHAWGETVVEQEATCTEPGIATTACTVCGEQTKVSIPATGKHTPGEKWETDATKHYHICSICGEAVDAADHAWTDVSIDQAATCSKPGSKTVACSVCGEQKTVTIPATGKHDYVGGICSVCGKDENACEHLIPHAEELDLSGLGICGKPTITVYKCDCGKVLNLDYDNLSCDFEVTETETDDGYTEISTCKTCGLRIAYSYYVQTDRENCTATHMAERVISVGGTELARAEREQGTELHPTTEVISTVALEGFCGEGSVVIKGCPCGKTSSVYYDKAPECSFEWDEALSTKTEDWYRCTTCGGCQVVTYGESVQNGCIYEGSTRIRFILNDVTLVDATSMYSNENHEYELESAELLGTTCEDGVVIRYSCSVCGDKLAYYTEYHETVYSEYIDLTDKDTCIDSIRIGTCPCPEKEAGYSLVGDTRCQWSYVSGNDDGTYYEYRCINCGLMRSELTVRGEKDENCSNTETRTTTFFRMDESTGERTVYAQITTNSTGTDHNTVERMELNGDSCLDGCTIYGTCLDCGKDLYEREFTDDYHYWPEGNQEILDLSAYNVCSGNLIKRSCACGQQGNIFWENGGCNWGWNEEMEAEQCINCGIVWKNTRELVEQIDTCHACYRRTYTVYMDGVELGTLSNETVSEDHSAVAEFDLLGETCEDGYYVKETCLDCGEVIFDSAANNGVYKYHNNWLLERELVCSGEGGCGPIYRYVYGCACGENSNTEWSIPCQMEWVSYDSETNTTVVACVNCGLEQHYTTLHREPTAVPCQYSQIRVDVFVKDGEEVAFVEAPQLSWSHQYITEFTPLGETCDDGYYFKSYCQTCGDLNYDSAENEDIRYGHNMQTTAFETLHDGEGLCGPIYKQTSACACGEYHDEYINRSCNNWSDYYDEALDTWVYVCGSCGLEWYTASGDRTATGEPCQYTRNMTYTFRMGGEVLCSAEIQQLSWSHQWITEFDLLGETCEDGYYYKRYCQICGELDYDTSEYGEISYGHDMQSVAYELLHDGEGLCGPIYKGTNACACGEYHEEHLNDSCNSWSGHYDNELDAWAYTCDTCGLERVELSEGGMPTGEPCQYAEVATYIYRKDGVELFTTERAYTYYSHSNVQYTLTLEGETCTDGYRVTTVCLDCGQTEDRGIYNSCGDHRWAVELTVLSDVEGTCGKLYLKKYVSCPCEKTISYNITGSCQFEHVGYDQGMGDIYRCTECGLEKATRYDDVVIEERCCVDRMFWYYITYNEQQVNWSSVAFQVTQHTMETHTQLLGKTCEDGYTVTRQCKYCDYCEDDGEVHTDHNTYYRGEVDAAELGLCEGSWIELWSCACGQAGSMNRYFNGCNTQYKHEEQADGYHTVTTCADCGLHYEYTAIYTPTSETCVYNSVRTTVLSVNGNILYNFQETYGETTRHDYEYSVVLAEGSVTCEDGVICTETCRDCGYSESWTRNYHERFDKEIIDLAAGTDACGAQLVHYGCACGMNDNWQLAGDCILRHIGDSEELGNKYRCTECGLEVTEKTVDAQTEDPCQITRTMSYTASYGGEQIAADSRTYSLESHDTKVVTYLQGETCEDGYTVKYECQNCDYVREDSGIYTSHDTYFRGTVEAEELGLCEGSWIDYWSCACGQRGSIDRYFNGCSTQYEREELADGYRVVITCADCGLYYEYTESTTATDVVCEYIEVDTTVLSVNGITHYAFQMEYYPTRHNWSTTCTLLPGSVTCEDGVLRERVCLDCGHTDSYEITYHAQFNKESIDLASCGSVCGAQLVNSACACGRYNNWYVEGKCDPGYQETEAWIDNAVEYWSGDTSEGYVNIDSYFYDVRCAVTDPQCGLQLRQASYWLAENCMATQYINWQRYDEATGTWVDLAHEATGETRPCHSYEYTWSSEALEDGGSRNTALYTCALCGSYAEDVRTYDADGNLTSSIDENVELTDNGFNQRYVRRVEYVKFGSHHTVTLDEYWCINAEGVKDEGRRYEYTFGYPDACIRYRKTYDMDGNLVDEWEEVFHLENWTTTTIKEATCSQEGYYCEENVCEMCGKVTDSRIYTDPCLDHDFWWDSTLQTYVCQRCDLENTNGVSGTIVMEDMTAQYGNDVNYVIGYHNYGSSDFLPNATVILEEAEGDDNQILLDTVEFAFLTEENDNLTAVTCNIQQVEEAAIAALQNAGYTGSYAIRISFVPVGSGSDLDYAITFDSKTIA